ncbi:resistin-like isoform X2 [Pleurodeles waltl]
MKSAIFLGVVLLLLPGFLAACSECCSFKDLENLQSLITSMAPAILKEVRTECIEISARGALATCPSGYTPYACACGMGCGSWDIRDKQTCHCQCANIDWTNAHCCKIVAN